MEITNGQFYLENAGSAKLLVDQNGNIGAGTLTPAASIHGKATSVSTKPIVAQATAGQTANLREWQNSSGMALSVVDASGRLGAGISAPVRQVYLQANNAFFRMDRESTESIDTINANSLAA